MIVKTVVKGRRTIYQLRHSATREIISAASAEYLDLINRHHDTKEKIDSNLRTLCNYRENKLQQLLRSEYIAP